LKSCSAKFTPINGFFYFDATESLPDVPLPAVDVKPRNCRYDSQIAVFGFAAQEVSERSERALRKTNNGVHTTLMWTVPEQLMRNKMRLAEIATVSNFKRLKPPCVGDAADSSGSPVFHSRDEESANLLQTATSTTKLTHLIRLARSFCSCSIKYSPRLASLRFASLGAAHLQAQLLPGRRRRHWLRNVEELGLDGGGVRRGGAGPHHRYGQDREEQLEQAILVQEHRYQQCEEFVWCQGEK